MNIKHWGFTLLATALLGACANVAEELEEKVAYAPTETSEAAEPTIEEAPEQEDLRVIVTTVAAAEVLAELGANVIGVPATQHPLPPQFDGLPPVGNAHNLDMEIIASLEGDLLIIDAGFREANEPFLEELGIEAFFFETNAFANFTDSIAQLGELIHRESEAAALVSRLQSASQIQLPDELPTVAIIFGAGEDFMLATGNSYVGNLVQTLGVSNLADELEGAMFAPFLPFSLEQIVAYDPAVILRFAHASVPNADEMFNALFDEHPVLGQLSGQIIDLDARIFGVSANLQVEAAFSILGEIFNDLP